MEVEKTIHQIPPQRYEGCYEHPQADNLDSDMTICYKFKDKINSIHKGCSLWLSKIVSNNMIMRGKMQDDTSGKQHKTIIMAKLIPKH
jgi:hypothetical protein